MVTGMVVKISNVSTGFYLNNKGTLQATAKGKGKKSTKFLFRNGVLLAENRRVLTVVKRGRKIMLKMLKPKKKKGLPVPTQIWEFVSIY